MKLRIRSMESKETHKIQLPSPSSLQDLKLAIAETIASPSIESIQLSLNRKDRIEASLHDSLHSIGIASGDLIFYTQNPNGFLPGETLTQQQPINLTHSSHNVESSHKPIIADGVRESNLENIIEIGNSSNELNMGDLKHGENEGGLRTLVSEDEVMGDLKHGEAEGGFRTLVSNDEVMGVDEENEEEQDVLVENLSSVPCFLKKVLSEEIGNSMVDYKLLVIAVHAVLLESGFVCLDSKTQNAISGYRLPEGWASECTSMSVRYTVSELLNSGGGLVETVVLKFMTWGKFVKVYGSLSQSGAHIYQVCLDKSCFGPSIDFVGMNNVVVGDTRDGSLSKLSHESKVFEFWKMAKDKLALPLLIDLCEKTGLPSPPCFTRLPFDLKSKIVELLPGVDIAKFGCTCSESRYLASNNDLWRQKVVEEFPFSTGEEDHWKAKFAKCWKTAKRRARAMEARRRDHREMPRRDNMIFRPREPRPFLFPAVIGGAVIGGDYDRFPAPFGSLPALPAMPGLNYGQPQLLGNLSAAGRNPRRRGFVPNCNLGGHNM